MIKNAHKYGEIIYSQSCLLKLTEHNMTREEAYKIVQKEASYRKQIEEKKLDMEKKYTTKLEQINENVKTLVSNQAHKENYNLVLPVGMVISGGDDITDKIVKNMK